MNKYQEALLKLGEYTVVLSWSKNQTCSIAELNEFKLLQELVDKAIPKKPNKIIDDTYEYYFCPNCESQVIENLAYYTEWEGDTTLHIVYCPSCGQALKWKDCY